MSYRNFECLLCSNTRTVWIYHNQYERYIVRCTCYSAMKEVKA